MNAILMLRFSTIIVSQRFKVERITQMGLIESIKEKQNYN